MRRSPIITRSILVFLILSGFFNLLSYSLDQMVVQQEDNIREITREVNMKKTELDTLRYSLNTIEDLTYTVSRYYNNFLADLDNVNKLVQFFNPEAKISDEAKKKIYSDQEITKINKIYQKDYHELITEINTRIEETLKFFNFSFGSGIGYELIKDDSEFKKVQQIKKIPKNILQDYNFENKETEETIDKNYDIYGSLYKSIESFGELRGSLSQLSREKIQPHYIKLFSNYFDDLDRYSSTLSIKNYYILYSILSQILGITFFLMLFRSILANREKK